MTELRRMELSPFCSRRWLAGLALTVAGCEFGGTPEDPRKCKITPDDLWNSAQIDLATQTPPACPVLVSTPGELHQYTGTLTAPAENVQVLAFVIVTIYDADNFGIATEIAGWTVVANQADAIVALDYPAGLIQSLSGIPDERDTLIAEVEILSPFETLATAGVYLPYTDRIVAEIYGDATVEVGQFIMLSTSVENAYPPVTYEWWMNDQPMSESSSSVSHFAGSPGTYTFDLVVTDGDGTEGDATFVVEVPAPGGGGGGGGDPCILPPCP